MNPRPTPSSEIDYLAGAGGLRVGWWREQVEMSSSMAATEPMPPRAPEAVQLRAAAAQAKSSWRASGQSWSSA